MPEYLFEHEDGRQRSEYYEMAYVPRCGTEVSSVQALEKQPCKTIGDRREKLDALDWVSNVCYQNAKDYFGF